MKFNYDGKSYEVVIVRKVGNRNTYIRVNSDLQIVVTANHFTSISSIRDLIEDNYLKIAKMIDTQLVKKDNNDGFYYLGKHYDIVYVNNNGISVGENKVFVDKDFDIDKWYKEKAKVIFKEHLDYWYDNFSRNIPYPKLRIRKMSTRWGVCNVSSKIVTLNLELIKRNTKYLDYVIVHELSHLVYANHSNSFWNLVEENMPDCKKYRKEMKNF